MLGGHLIDHIFAVLVESGVVDRGSASVTAVAVLARCSSEHDRDSDLDCDAASEAMLQGSTQSCRGRRAENSIVMSADCLEAEAYGWLRW